ncbi:MAG: hypothetical protein NTV44_00035 [Firmicutes bacterium]|nr:hypothetical protein [Bacillota bacterium]
MTNKEIDDKKAVEVVEPKADESQVPPKTKGEIIFPRVWLIICGVLLLIIIILSIIVKLLPE